MSIKSNAQSVVSACSSTGHFVVGVGGKLVALPSVTVVKVESARSNRRIAKAQKNLAKAGFEVISEMPQA